MLDKILRSLDATTVDVPTIRLIGKYISENKDGPYNGFSRQFAYLAKQKSIQDKLKSTLLVLDDKERKIIESQRVDGIRKDHKKSLSEISSYQRKQDDLVRSKTDQVKNEMSKILSDIKRVSVEKTDKIETEIKDAIFNNESILTREINTLKDGQKEIASKFFESFSSAVKPDDLTNTGKELKDLISSIKEKLDETPIEPETEQILIEETGQVITVQK